MKTLQRISILASMFAWSTYVSAQGTIPFQNLNFEAATVAPLSAGQDEYSVPVAAAFPGWTGYWGTNVAAYAGHNGLSLGGVFIIIEGPNSSPILQGNFTALLQGGWAVDSSTGNTQLYPAAASIAQIGTLPAGSQSIRFFSIFQEPEVRFDEQVIPTVFLGTGLSSAGTAYNILGGDISALAGQTGELRFSSLPPASPPGLAYLDNIYFSSEPIPEPSILSLLGLGVLLLGCSRSRGVNPRR